MAAKPTPQGISAVLRNAGFKRSVSSPSRIKGMTEHSAGYQVRKQRDGMVEVRYRPGVNRNALWTEEKLAAFTKAIEAAGFKVERDSDQFSYSLIVTSEEA